MSFFRGLRGKLTLTYTLVTVLTMMALEALLIILVLLVSAANRADERGYLGDVVTMLYPAASEYLQPGAEDLPGLQLWLDEVAASGEASLAAQGLFDSPAAQITPGEPLLVLSPEGIVIAQSPREPNDLVGRHFTPPPGEDYRRMIDEAMGGSSDALLISARTERGGYRVAVPVFEDGRDSDVLGLVVVAVEPAPSMLGRTWPVYVGAVVGSGLLLMMGVAPFGALFGYIMSRGLTRRLQALSRAADAWSEGDFSLLPSDHSNDEIGALGMRLRRMAERIHTLLQTQQQLAMLEERNRLARELHDTVKQQTFATLMQVRAARNLLTSDPEAARKHLSDAEGLIKTSQQDLGMMIAELRPAELEGQGLSGALRAYITAWSEHSRIPAEVNVSDERRLPLALEQALYRVAQEALSNAARHSRASAVHINVAFDREEVRMEVADNGMGFATDQNGSGFGLESMRERMAALGGQLVVNSNPEQGTRITAFAPTGRRNN